MFKIIKTDKCLLTGYNRVYKGDYEFGVVVIEFRDADTGELAMREQYQRDEKLATREWEHRGVTPSRCFALYEKEFNDLWRGVYAGVEQ